MDATKTRTTATDPMSVRPGSQSPRLVMLKGPDIGRQIELSGEPVYIGRGDDVTLRVDSDLISRKHACIMRFGGADLLKDLGSTNGTFVNGVKIDGTQALEEGDQIQVGRVVLRYTANAFEAAYHEQVVERARIDALTRAYNKGHFDGAYRATLKKARDAGTPCSLVVLDIDHFKRINDEHGHLVGDHVLSQVADFVRRELPDDVLFARVGGEEFAIVLEEPLERAREIAERVRRGVEAATIASEGEQIDVTVSLGCAVPLAEQSAEELYAEADRLLYEAKRGGRNQVR